MFSLSHNEGNNVISNESVAVVRKDFKEGNILF